MGERGGVVEVIIKAKDLTASALNKFKASMKSVLGTITKLAAGFVAATAALTKLGQQGAKAIGVKVAFARITDDEAAALQRLRQASGGTITDLELMQRANQAMALGTARSVDEFARMLRVSDALGDSLGIDGAQAMEKFADVMASGSQRAARALGIEIEAGMTRNQILERAEEVANRIKGEMGDGVEAADRFWTSIKNGKDRISEMVVQSAPISAFFDTLAKGVDLAVVGFEKLLKLLRLLPADWDAAIGAGAGGGGGAMAALQGWMAEVGPPAFRDMSGHGVSPEGVAAWRARRRRRAEMAVGPVGMNPLDSAENFGGDQLPGVGVTAFGFKDAALEIADAEGVFVDSMGRMADAATSESARMSDAILATLQNLVANIKTDSGGLFGSTLLGGLVGVGIGLFGTLFRKDKPVEVEVAKYKPEALAQMKEASGPKHITTVIEQGGVEIERIEADLGARSRHDGVVRYSRGKAVS